MGKVLDILAEWNATGQEPDQSKKDNGWAASEKPPADWFNWLFNKNYLSSKNLDLKKLSNHNFFGDGFVETGGEASKNGTTATQLDVTALKALVKQSSDGEIEYVEKNATSFDTSGTASTTFYLDLNEDGSYNWAESHSSDSNYLAIAEVTTDSNGDISTVTDVRDLTPNFIIDSLENKVNEIINVKDYDAVGDGSTDDTSAIKNAINEADQQNKILFFPAGTYLISDELNIPPNVMVRGSGWDNTVILQNNDNIVNTIKVKGSDSGFSEAQGLFDLNVENNGIRGSSSNVRNGISYSNTFRGKIHRVKVSGFYRGIELLNLNSGWTEATSVKDVHVDDCEIGITFDKGSGTGSFGYTNIRDLYINVGVDGGIGVEVKQDAVFYNSRLEVVVWLQTGTQKYLEIASNADVGSNFVNFVGEIPAGGADEGQVDIQGGMGNNWGGMHIQPTPTMLNNRPYFRRSGVSTVFAPLAPTDDLEVLRQEFRNSEDATTSSPNFTRALKNNSQVTGEADEVVDYMYDGSSYYNFIAYNYNGGDPLLKLAQKLNLTGAPTQTTVGGSGAGDSLPSTPVGYIEISIDGTPYVIPYYNKS